MTTQDRFMLGLLLAIVLIGGAGLWTKHRLEGELEAYKDSRNFWIEQYERCSNIIHEVK